MNNAAFEQDAVGEIYRILETVTDKLMLCGTMRESCTLRDVNGNVVGTAKVTA